MNNDEDEDVKRFFDINIIITENTLKEDATRLLLFFEEESYEKLDEDEIFVFYPGKSLISISPNLKGMYFFAKKDKGFSRDVVLMNLYHILSVFFGRIEFDLDKMKKVPILFPEYSSLLDLVVECAINKRDLLKTFSDDGLTLYINCLKVLRYFTVYREAWNKDILSMFIDHLHEDFMIIPRDTLTHIISNLIFTFEEVYKIVSNVFNVDLFSMNFLYLDNDSKLNVNYLYKYIYSLQNCFNIDNINFVFDGVRIFISTAKEKDDSFGYDILKLFFVILRKDDEKLREIFSQQSDFIDFVLDSLLVKVYFNERTDKIHLYSLKCLNLFDMKFFETFNNQNILDKLFEFCKLTYNNNPTRHDIDLFKHSLISLGRIFTYSRPYTTNDEYENYIFNIIEFFTNYCHDDEKYTIVIKAKIQEILLNIVIHNFDLFMNMIKNPEILNPFIYLEKYLNIISDSFINNDLVDMATKSLLTITSQYERGVFDEELYTFVREFNWDYAMSFADTNDNILESLDKLIAS